MTKSEEQFWRRYFAEGARRWINHPWVLVATMESIMELSCHTARQKLMLMKQAMEAYNDAVKEASSNAESMPD